MSDFKGPGETFANLLAEMIEHEKKRRLFLDMERIEKEGNFVELSPLTYRLLIEEKALEFLQSLPEKSRRLVSERGLAPGGRSLSRKQQHRRR